MRAALLLESGKPFTLVDDVQLRAPRAGEVLVRVQHCGMCHSDLTVAESPAAPVPLLLGHEAAGVVQELGAGVTALSPGDKVVLTPAPPCGRCYYCQRAEFSLCLQSEGILTHAFPDGSSGLSRAGGVVHRGLNVAAFAEYAVLPETGAVRVPPDTPLDVACVIGCAVQTGVGAVLNTAQVVEGASVLVLGAGGVGLSAVQGAVLAGAARILVSDPVAQRREAARRFGATHVLDPGESDVAAAAREITEGVGVDYAFESAGRAELITQAYFAARKGGTVVCVGAPPVPEALHIEPAALFTVEGKKLMGTLLGGCNSVRDIPRLVALWRAGRLDLEALITARRPLAEINECAADLRAARGVRTVLDI